MWLRSKRTASPSTSRLNAIADRTGSTPAVNYTTVQRAPRQPVFKPATAVLPFGERVPVIIKSLSGAGMRIEYFQKRDLPDAFTIVEPTLPLCARVEVSWREDRVVGLRLVNLDNEPSSRPNQDNPTLNVPPEDLQPQ